MLTFLLTGNQLILCKEVFSSHMFNLECCTLTVHDRGSLKSFKGDSDQGEAWRFCIFLRQTARKGGSNFHGGRSCDLHRNYGVVIILLSLLVNYDHLILKLHQKKRQLPWWRMAFYWQIQSWKCVRNECCSCSI